MEHPPLPPIDAGISVTHYWVKIRGKIKPDPLEYKRGNKVYVWEGLMEAHGFFRCPSRE